ncbi:hypothetical protein TNCV_1721971 [Trichonephila clavipes]|nr:hypothetical protein TNCV_1721971 [Trichonephila clavipes]
MVHDEPHSFEPRSIPKHATFAGAPFSKLPYYANVKHQPLYTGGLQWHYVSSPRLDNTCHEFTLIITSIAETLHFAT